MKELDQGELLNPKKILELKNSPELIRKMVDELPLGLSFFYFCSLILGYGELDPIIHGRLCDFLVNPIYGRFRDATVPRSWFKTSIGTVGKSLWLSVRNPNIRILISMNTFDNASKQIHVIKNNWESNELLRQTYPELIPDFKHTRWSDKCAEIRRTQRNTEGTYEAIGVGGAVVSRHYDHIVEDDLVYASKDELTGSELMPSQEEIEKAIGWHKLVHSLFSNPSESTLDNIGTRWAPHDLKDHIFCNEPFFKRFHLSAEDDDGQAVWEDRFPKEVLDAIRGAQGETMFATQYLNKPRDLKDMAFNIQWLKYYQSEEVIPQPIDNITIVDLAGWGDSKGKARNVILTLSTDGLHEHWVRRYDIGKFNPTEVIELIESHVKAFNSRVYVEEVQYQRALRHFALQKMKETDNRYIINALPYDGRSNAKHLRIVGIQPTMQNGWLHIKPSMKELVTEVADYPHGIRCDILDCLGYAIERKLYRVPETTKVAEKENPFRLDKIIEEFDDRKHSSISVFDVQFAGYNEAGGE